MAETSIINTLINQAPGMATLVIVVVLFLRFMEKRDGLFISQMKDVSAELRALQTLLTSHDTWEREVVGEIQKDQRSATRKPRAKP